MISLDRTIALPAAPGEVWEALWDVPALARCIPGCEEVTEVEPGRRYRALVKDRVGPFSIAVPLDVTVEPVAEERRLTVAASGRDSVLGSPVRVALATRVDADPAGGSALRLSGRAEVGGKLAALGQAVIQRKTRDLLEAFATRLGELLRSRGNAGAV